MKRIQINPIAQAPNQTLFLTVVDILAFFVLYLCNHNGLNQSYFQMNPLFKLKKTFLFYFIYLWNFCFTNIDYMDKSIGTPPSNEQVWLLQQFPWVQMLKHIMMFYGIVFFTCYSNRLDRTLFYSNMTMPLCIRQGSKRKWLIQSVWKNWSA